MIDSSQMINPWVVYMFKARESGSLIPHRVVLYLLIGIFTVLIGMDILRHVLTGSVGFNVVIDSFIGIVVLLFFAISKSKFTKHILAEKEFETKMSSLREEIDEWKKRSSTFLLEFESLIQSQFVIWGLTSAEKDVALLLVKGLSFSEIATIRGTTNNTVRNQAHTIYSKSNLKSRTELAAYFMEELLNSK